MAFIVIGWSEYRALQDPRSCIIGAIKEKELNPAAIKHNINGRRLGDLADKTPATNAERQLTQRLIIDR